MQVRMNGQSDRRVWQVPVQRVTGARAAKTRTGVIVDRPGTTGPLIQQFLAGHRTAACFIGLSVCNRMANRRSLRELLPWVLRLAQKNSLPVRIVVGDYLSRHNLMAFDGHDPAKAGTKALKLGERPRRYAREIVRELGVENTVLVQSCGELLRSTRCAAIVSMLNAFAGSNPRFAWDLAEEARSFIRRRNITGKNAADEALVQQLVCYVVEETAMFLLLYEMGYRVEVYPGPDLRIMRLIATGAYPGFPCPCTERSHVAVQLPVAEGTFPDGGS